MAGPMLLNNWIVFIFSSSRNNFFLIEYLKIAESQWKFPHIQKSVKTKSNLWYLYKSISSESGFSIIILSKIGYSGFMAYKRL